MSERMTSTYEAKTDRAGENDETNTKGMPTQVSFGRRPPALDDALSLKAFYDAEGYVAPIPVLTPPEASAALAEYERFASSLPGGVVSGNMRFKPHLHLPFASRLSRHPAILDVVQTVLGTPNILLWSSDFNVKAPGSGGHFPLHQDATYAGLDPPELCLTVWLALSDPVDEERGCMTYIPGSHRAGQIPHREGTTTGGDEGGADPNNMLSRRQSVDPREIPSAIGGGGGGDGGGGNPQDILVPLTGGQASLHHFHLLHRSGPNRGPSSRVGLAMRYAAASVCQTGAEARESVTLVRGRTEHDGFDLEPVLPAGEGSTELTEERRAEALEAHADAMRRESANYFAGCDASEYDGVGGGAAAAAATL